MRCYAVQSGNLACETVAIPVNTVRCVLPLMMSGTQVEHPWLGIAGTGITPELADRFHLGSRTGVLVTEVMEGSPASRTGLAAFSHSIESDPGR